MAGQRLRGTHGFKAFSKGKLATFAFGPAIELNIATEDVRERKQMMRKKDLPAEATKGTRERLECIHT